MGKKDILARTMYNTKKGIENSFVNNGKKLKRKKMKHEQLSTKIMKNSRLSRKSVKIIKSKLLNNISKRDNIFELEEDSDLELGKSIYSDMCFNEINSDSIKDGMKLFEQILKPLEIEHFLKHFWEKTPCLIRKNNKNIFGNLISFGLIDEVLRQHHVEFTKNVDVTSYKNGKRVTLNPEGRALPPDVWNFYNSGCSIRFLNPQTFMPLIYKMNVTLQEYFHCLVGANVYLTPPNSQGFAPHYDDIEAFVLQIEGEKRWNLYAPRTAGEQLPRYSSKNLSPNEIGSPIFEVVLKAGDILYFPRGTIHQALTEPGHHSLHITLSVYQKQSYGDLLEVLLPIALTNAIKTNLNLREGLPLNIWRNLGSVHCNNDNLTRERHIIGKRCKELIKQVIDNIPLDDAVDQLAKKYQRDALPPMLSQNEMVRTVFGNKSSLSKKGEAKFGRQINLNTHVRLLRANIMRLVEEENVFRIYYYVDNSKEYHEYDANFIEVEVENVYVICQLIKLYPCFIKVMDLSLGNDDDKVDIAKFLWGRGLLMTKEALST